MSENEIKVQPPSDKQPVIDINTGCWTKYGQRQQWDMWKRTGGFTDDVWAALLAGLIGSTQFSAIINQFEAMQNEIAELRTEIAARQSYDDQIEELRIQIAAAQQISENIVQQQESTRQEIEAREELQIARQVATNGGLEARQWANVQAIADTDLTVANLTTTSIPEGTRLYYTDARARLAISASGDVSYNNLTGVISYTTPSNSATATKLATPRNIAITGDLAWSVSFDGSGNVTAAGTLATVNGNVGSFGSTTTVPVITVNAKGLITAVTTAALGTAAVQNTGTSGANLPFLNGVNTWSGAQTFPTDCGISGAAGTARQIFGLTGTSPRWRVVLGNNAAESGGNAGSIFLISRYDDSGTFISNVLSIDRTTGLVAFPAGINVGTYVAVPGIITGYITINDAGGTARKIAVTT